MTHDRPHRVRLLVVPGLNDSGPAHWQTWLQAHWRDALRVQQADWSVPDLARWSRRISQAVASDPGAHWVGVAHSFGTLALTHHLAHARAGRTGVAAALLVAPADPTRFGLDAALPRHPLGVPTVMLASATDPWMRAEQAAIWARRWGARFANLGDVGHVNVDAGYGPFPPALRLTRALMRRVGWPAGGPAAAGAAAREQGAPRAGAKGEPLAAPPARFLARPAPAIGAPHGHA